MGWPYCAWCIYEVFVMGFRCHTILRCQLSCRAKHCPKVETWYLCLHCLCVLYHLRKTLGVLTGDMYVHKISDLNLILLHYANTHSTHNTSMGVNVMTGVNYPCKQFSNNLLLVWFLYRVLNSSYLLYQLGTWTQYEYSSSQGVQYFCWFRILFYSISALQWMPMNNTTHKSN